MTLRLKKFLILTISILCIHSWASDKPVNIVISASTAFQEYYANVVGDQHTLEFDNFTHPKVRRNLTGIVLFSKALHLGGLNHTISFIDSPNYTRSLTLVKAGLATTMSETAWLSNISKNDFHISLPLFELGDSQKGIYTLPDRVDVLAIKTVEELRKFKTVSSPSWKVDWDAIISLRLPRYDTIHAKVMHKMLKQKRVDYLFLPFPKSKDLISTDPGFEVHPVKGLKRLLPGSRHFVISKKTPHAEEIFTALQKGIIALRKIGAIRKAYIQSGYINPQVDDWKPLNPVGF